MADEKKDTEKQPKQKAKLRGDGHFKDDAPNDELSQPTEKK